MAQVVQDSVQDSGVVTLMGMAQVSAWAARAPGSAHQMGSARTTQVSDKPKTLETAAAACNLNHLMCPVASVALLNATVPRSMLISLICKCE